MKTCLANTIHILRTTVMEWQEGKVVPVLGPPLKKESQVGSKL